MAGELIINGRSFDVPDGRLVDVWNANVRTTSKYVKLVGEHDVVDPGIDCTALRRGTILNFWEARINGRTTGSWPAVDMTHSTGLTVLGLRIVGADDCPPRVGLLLSRHHVEDDKADRAAGKHFFERLNIQGAFRLAALYSIGSEENRFVAPVISNELQDAACTIYLGRYNRHGVTSQHGLNPSNDASATGCAIWGLHCRSSQMGSGKAAIIIAGHSKVRLTDCYISSRDVPYVWLDVTRQSVSGFEARGFQGQGSPSVGLLLDGEFAHGIAGVRFEAVQCGSSRSVVKFGPVDVTHAYIDHYELVESPVVPGVPVEDVEIDPGAKLEGCSVRRRRDALATSIDRDPTTP